MLLAESTRLLFTRLSPSQKPPRLDTSIGSQSPDLTTHTCFSFNTLLKDRRISLRFMTKSPNPFVHGSVYYDCLTRFIFHQHKANFSTRSHSPPPRRSERRNSRLKGRSIVRRRMAKQPRRTLSDQPQAY